MQVREKSHKGPILSKEVRECAAHISILFGAAIENDRVCFPASTYMKSNKKYSKSRNGSNQPSKPKQKITNVTNSQNTKGNI